MDCIDRSDLYCVIGAGPSGLTAAKNLLQMGIGCEVLEREDDVGGNWYYGKPNSSVYHSTHLISSKRLTEFVDFPMPQDYPPFPRHDQVWQYFRDYARHFQLYDRIRFNTSVTRVEPCGDEWLVDVDTPAAQRRRYRGLVIANGHHWDPKWPNYAGSFTGEMLHSSQYKTADVLAGRRVLVIGAGNSGCDIAVEAARHARCAWISLRRGYHFLPKFLFGKPIDACGERLLRWHLPLWLRRRISSCAARVALGPPQRYGLPEPDHQLFETHPIINSQMLYEVGHGRIVPKPDVLRFDAQRVYFVDESVEEVDLVICATGFHISIPFIDRELLNFHDQRPQLFLNAFPPQRDNLFVAGLIQPDSGLWGLVDYQAQLFARFVRAAQEQRPEADWFRRQKQLGECDMSGGIRYVHSPRHLLEVEHFSYRRTLQKLIRRLDGGDKGR